MEPKISSIHVNNLVFELGCRFIIVCSSDNLDGSYALYINQGVDFKSLKKTTMY